MYATAARLRLVHSMLDLLCDNEAVGRLQSLVVVGNAACHCKAKLLIELQRIAVGRLNVKEHFAHLGTALSVVQYGLQQSTACTVTAQHGSSSQQRDSVSSIAGAAEREVRWQTDRCRAFCTVRALRAS